MSAIDIIPKVKLNTGREVPIIGIGTWRASGDEVLQAVKDAIAGGYRHIDTASYYGNEKEVGLGVQQSITDGVIKREDIFITTKVWPSEDMDRKRSLQSIETSLKNLNTYIDLALVHWPHNDYTEIYRGLEDAFRHKLVRSIGVSNFDVNILETFLKNVEIVPAMNQILFNPHNQQIETINYCQSRGIQITGYRPLGKGALLSDPTLLEIGKRYNKTAAQVLIRWHIDKGIVVIPKSVKKERIIENFNVFDFKLTDDEIKTINNMKE